MIPTHKTLTQKKPNENKQTEYAIIQDTLAILNDDYETYMIIERHIDFDEIGNWHKSTIDYGWLYETEEEAYNHIINYINREGLHIIKRKGIKNGYHRWRCKRGI